MNYSEETIAKSTLESKVIKLKNEIIALRLAKGLSDNPSSTEELKKEKVGSFNRASSAFLFLLNVVSIDGIGLFIVKAVKETFAKKGSGMLNQISTAFEGVFADYKYPVPFVI